MDGVSEEERLPIGDDLKRKRARIHSKLKIAVVNAIPHEQAAILAVFGEPKPVPSRDFADTTIYYVEVKKASGDTIFVVLGGLTSPGIAQAAAATAGLKARCRYVQRIIMVGIAAGQPNATDAEKDVRLGDIVVGEKIIQYDHVKRTNGSTELRGDNIPLADPILLQVVGGLRALQDPRGDDRPERPWIKHLNNAVGRVRSARRPPRDRDLFSAKRKYTKGLQIDRAEDEPYVHVGTIGSASTLLKDEIFRNDLNTSHGTVAYEMEGAGLAVAAAASGIRYLMVRGICDYADDEKDDAWQTYASVAAASFALSVLERL